LLNRNSKADIQVVKFFACFETGRFITVFTATLTCSSSEPDQSSSRPPSYFLKVHLIIFSHLRPDLTSCLFPSDFPTFPLPLTCHMPLPSHSWFD